MKFWFSRDRALERLDPIELRDRLIRVAATGSARELRSLCQRCKSQVAEHVDVFTKLPDGTPTDDGSIDRYLRYLVAVAQCLAKECDAPELWNALRGNPEDNPLDVWNRWFGEFPERVKRLEYDALISEAEAFLERAKPLRGGQVRRGEAILQGRLGELLFHSGRVAEAIAPSQSALELRVETNDVEGQIIYLWILLEAHRYLDDGQAISIAERLLEVSQAGGVSTTHVEKRLKRLRQGEPLCRVVCVRDGHEWELDEITDVGEGSYQFRFQRDRLSLHKAITLTEQGDQLASSGQLSDALEKYHQASEVDPHDPGPVYQSGMCLLELGAYAKARDAFEEVERLAPGWFRCRTDRWLADGLDAGTISTEEFALLRALDDGGLEKSQAIAIAKQAIERFPDFAPSYLYLGDSTDDEAEAIAAYRRGLELVQEPDLESRLLCALAAKLPRESPERIRLIERAVHLKGSLVAQATARLMRIWSPSR